MMVPALALLSIATLPVNVPVVVGAKVTLKEVLCPAVSVRGSVNPLTLNSAPVTVAFEMVTEPVPTFFRITGNVLFEPVCTFAKLVFVGVAERINVGVTTTSTPVPVNGI